MTLYHESLKRVGYRQTSELEGQTLVVGGRNILIHFVFCVQIVLLHIFFHVIFCFSAIYTCFCLLVWLVSILLYCTWLVSVFSIDSLGRRYYMRPHESRFSCNTHFYFAHNLLANFQLSCSLYHLSLPNNNQHSKPSNNNHYCNHFYNQNFQKALLPIDRGASIVVQVGNCDFR